MKGNNNLTSLRQLRGRFYKIKPESHQRESTLQESDCVTWNDHFLFQFFYANHIKIFLFH